MGCLENKNNKTLNISITGYAPNCNVKQIWYHVIPLLYKKKGQEIK